MAEKRMTDRFRECGIISDSEEDPEGNIRNELLDGDLLRAVIGLGSNSFYGSRLAYQQAE